MDRPFYSVTFGGKNSWDEWNLIPVKAGKIEFATPSVKDEWIEVAGSDDALDFTEVLTGYALYNQRRGSVKFRFYDNGTSSRSRFNQLKNYLHGKRMTAIIEDEPDYYYEGRFMVGDFEPMQGNWGDVNVSYILNAYKLEMTSTNEDWLWDPFNFETGVIREYGSLEVDGSLTVEVIGSRKPTVPKFIVTGGTLTLTIDGTVYVLNEGTTTIPQIKLFDETYTFEFTGTGTVTIDYRGGSL